MAIEEQNVSVETGRGSSHARMPHASVLFRYWIGLVVAAVVIAVVTTVVAAVLPASYSATSSIAVTFPSSVGSQLDTSNGANAVASQVAGLANSAPVIASAANTLGISTDGLSGRVAGVQAGTSNLVNITATGTSATSAAQLAAADAQALKGYVVATYAKQAAVGSARLQATPSQVLAKGQIAQAQAAIAADEAIIKAGPASSPAVANALTDLTSQRQLLGTLIVNDHSTQQVDNLLLGLPSVNIVNGNPAGGSSTLSAIAVGLIALIVGFFVAWEVLYLFLNGKRAYEADNQVGGRAAGGDA